MPSLDEARCVGLHVAPTGPRPARIVSLDSVSVRRSRRGGEALFENVCSPPPQLPKVWGSGQHERVYGSSMIKNTERVPV